MLHSRIIGSGQAFIILHGFLGMSDNWKSLGNSFASNGYQVHLVDQRNHGRSFHSDAHSYELMARDLYQYCTDNQLENIILLGHSMGGKTAMEFASRYPSLVSKLIIADIGPKKYIMDHHERILKALSQLDLNSISSRKEADLILSAEIKDIGFRQFLLKNLYWIDKDQFGLRINLPVLSREDLEIGAALDRSAKFEKDTLFIRAEKSGYIQDIDKDLILYHFPKAMIITLPDTGHWLHAENPNEFFQIVLNFL